MEDAEVEKMNSEIRKFDAVIIELVNDSLEFMITKLDNSSLPDNLKSVALINIAVNVVGNALLDTVRDENKLFNLQISMINVQIHLNELFKRILYTTQNESEIDKDLH